MELRVVESPHEAAPSDQPSQSAETLFAEVYSRLKAMAGRQLASARADSTLDTTALVHELYLRVCKNREVVFQHSSQFFTYAARAMRHLLLDRARDRLRQRAGGDWTRVTLTDGNQQLALESAEQALALDAALRRLEETDTRAAQVLELHYFAGLTIPQVAETLNVAHSTIDRDWRFARAFLKTEIAQ